MAISAPVPRSPASSRPVRRPLFLVGIGLALVAFLLVLVLGSVLASRANQGTAQVAIVVAGQDIMHRHVITAEDLTIAHEPASAVPPGALTLNSQALGMVAQVDIPRGAPLTTNLIEKQGSGDPGFLAIPPGWIATTIPASELQAVGGYIASGDAIDIEATVSETAFTPSVANPRSITRTVFRDVHVLRVGPESAAGVTEGVTSSLTVLLTPCDAQDLDWLIANGTVRYTLRSPNDYGNPPTAPDPSCPVGTALVRVDPAEVDGKFHFTRG